MSVKLNPEEPIIIGLYGAAGAGKTSVANQFVPGGVVNVVNEKILDKEYPLYVLDHYWFAMPLYEMASIRRDIEGEHRRDRQLYEIHRVLVDLFGKSPLYGAPPYEELCTVVHEIQRMHIPREGKPRTFLQEVGDICRFYDPDCFTKWMMRHIRSQAGYHMKSSDDWEGPMFIAFASDLRFDNEAKAIHDSPNGLVIEFVADQEVLDQRIEKRDGYVMTEEQKNHKSEARQVKPEHIDVTFDTTTMSLEEQFLATKEFITETLDLQGI